MLHRFPESYKATLRNLEVVRVLEQFDGVILAEYKAVGTGGLYLKKWCDSEGSVNRWLIVRSDYRVLARYLAGKVTMLELLTCIGDGGCFIVDEEASNQQIIETYFTRFNELPHLYLPEDGTYHDEDLRPYWTMSPQSFLVGSDWDVGIFAGIEKRYMEVSSFAYFTMPGAQRRLPADILNYYYDGGFAVGIAYRRIRKSVPQSNRVKSAGVIASSPGVLTMDVPAELANHVATVISALKENIDNYKILHSWSKLKPEASARVPEDAMSDLLNLCEGLSVDIEAIFPQPTELVPNPKSDKRYILAAGKLIAAHCRRLWEVLKPGPTVEYVSIKTEAEESEIPDEVYDSDDSDVD